jgi:hypothetical protein
MRGNGGYATCSHGSGAIGFQIIFTSWPPFAIDFLKLYLGSRGVSGVDSHLGKLSPLRRTHYAAR